MQVAQSLMVLAKDIVGTEYDLVVVEALAGNKNAQNILKDKKFQNRMFEHCRKHKRPGASAFLKEATAKALALGFTGALSYGLGKTLRILQRRFK
jgi:hypothetical protein